VKKGEIAETIAVTNGNRNELHETIVEKAVKFLEMKEREQYSQK
jgi:hypothetical protein